MKSFGKIISVYLMISLLCVNAFAADTLYADTLYELGIFKGTDKGYELEKTLTREESVTILVRLLGEEENLESADFTETFSDVPSDRWSYPYVMYCYENEITRGTGEETFSPDIPVNAQQFTALILRLLGYTDITPENALEESTYLNLLNTQTVRKLEDAELFTREDMVYIVYRSLMCKMSDGTLLADALAERAVISEEEAAQFNVYETTENIDELLEKLLG